MSRLLVVSMAFVALGGPGCSLARTPISDRDAPGLDTGVPGDAPRPDGSSCDPTACNDANPCTDDACGASACVHTPNTAGCDDGLFCTTGEACAGGTCGGGSATCPTCDEGANSCGVCDGPEDCPTPMVGACAFDDVCDEEGTQTITTYTCVEGACTGSDAPTSCARSTTGTECGAPETTMGSCETTGRGCSAEGVAAVTTTRRVCGGGACGPVVSMDTMPCVYDPTGDACVSCEVGACVASFAGCTGTAVRSCAGGSCAGAGTCSPTDIAMVDTTPCVADVGATCTSRMCGPCMRTESRCQRTCTTSVGTCGAGGECAPGMGTTTAEGCHPSMCP